MDRKEKEQRLIRRKWGVPGTGGWWEVGKVMWLLHQDSKVRGSKNIKICNRATDQWLTSNREECQCM